MEFKVLLLMDNAGGHHADMYSEGVQIEFLPPNTISLIQPMEQGMIQAFKALYTKISLQRLVSAMDADENFTLKEYWREFTISTCLSVKQNALKEMKKHSMHAGRSFGQIVCRITRASPLTKFSMRLSTKQLKLAKLLCGEGSDDITEEEVKARKKPHQKIWLL
ncbi:hypothetical protein P4O66_002089 [Electrophorus voltai]|uniref:DDE-1 domain-containing protein n=1 Tax=Electrophorus voltai TaxID=2609070 RepID=A0AAD8Z4A1_9TELE|nr:hypothetical protein P4O66_002089 [Electrophorus voltai]